MAEKTKPESKPVPIDKLVEMKNPDQASTNFYWTYVTEAGIFNLQTTIRGTLPFEQIQSHIASALAGTAEVHRLGGQAKQIGRGAENQAPIADTPVPIETVVQPSVPMEPEEPVYVPPEPPVQPAPKVEELVFMTTTLTCTLSEGKQYFKAKGDKFPKYGVTVWPEVLTRLGIRVDKMEAKEYPFKGYKATYILNAKGNPEKITNLEKVA